ncbi:chitinase [Vibrio sp. SCSIO 43140]|uniref:Ig-like domain-containing protein n=1 Tax=Vibrio sp. SCSIO 43140 TaxID=2819100 RepID=UPI002075DD83|nr:Ig-like domain-containing protein [Vibrio sp. SCSIO 43140]USD61480.1 chitinase [Vibrio sp. SCSIO 43140]
MTKLQLGSIPIFKRSVNLSLMLTSSLLFSAPSLAVQCDSLPIWDDGTSYNGGAQVQWQSSAYQANWWNLNANPVNHSKPYQEWSLIGACDAGGTNAAPSVTITSPASNAQLASGNQVTFSALAEDSDGEVREVIFELQGAQLAVLSSAPYQVTWLTESGNYELVVTAIDDKGASTQSAQTFSVVDASNQPPVVTFTSSKTQVSVGDSVQFTAEPSDSDGTISKVEFRVNGALEKSVTVAPWVMDWISTAEGSYTIQAVATDDKGATSQSQVITVEAIASAGGKCSGATTYIAGSSYATGQNVVNNGELYQCLVGGWCSSDSAWAYEPGVGQYWQDAWSGQGACATAPNIELISPVEGETVLLGSDVTILANIEDLDGTVADAEAFVNGTSIGLVTASPYQWTWNAVGQASVDLKVIATDNEGNSNQLNTTVSVTDQPMVAAITSPSSGDVVAIGKAVTVNANVSSLQSEVAKVELYANGLLVNGDTTAPYQFSWTPTTIGNYQLSVISTDLQGNTVTSASVGVSAKSVVQPKHKLIGYWHNFVNGAGCPIPLNQMSKDWDIIDIAFADNDRNSNGTVHFNLYNGDIYSSCAPIDPVQFKQDIKDLQAEGKIIVLSLGGAEGTITLNTDTDETAFVSSLSEIINEWGFDGLDVDYESGSNLVHGSQIQARLPRALKAIEANTGGDMYLTMAPEHPYVQGGMVAYSGIWGAYIPLIDQLRDTLDLLHVQLYNNGGLANPYTTGAAPEGSVDMMVAASRMLTEGFELADGSRFMPLRDDQVAIGLPSGPSSANSGQAPIANIEDALDCMISLSRCGSIVPTQASPKFGGVMTWSINWDQHDGFNFSVPLKAKLNQLNAN